MSEEMEILDKLMADIKAGKYEPEDKLPSENELADQFGVPRITARMAYKILQERGYIYSKQGKGSYVRERKRQIPLVLSGSISFTTKMKELGYDYRAVNIGCDEIPYNKTIYTELGVGEPDKVYRIGRLRFVDNRPIALHFSFVSPSLFADIEQAGSQITSMFEYYRSKGYTQFNSKRSILSVEFPHKTERDYLETPSLIPMLVLESDCTDETTGKVLEVTKILYRSDVFTYVI